MVDMAWENGQLTEAQVHSTLGQDCTVRTTAAVTVTCDKVPVETEQADSVLTFETEVGKTYTLTL